MEGQPAGGQGGGCHLPVSSLSAHIPGPQPPASRLLLVPVLGSVLDPQDLQLCWQQRKEELGPTSQQRGSRWVLGNVQKRQPGSGTVLGRNKGRSQVSAAGEQMSELREQNPRHWGVGCLSRLLRLCQNPASPLPCIRYGTIKSLCILKTSVGRSVQNAPRALCLAPLERARPCAHRPNCRQEGLKKEHSA